VHSSAHIHLAGGRSTSGPRVPLQPASLSASGFQMTSSFLPAKLDTMWLLIDAPAVLEVVGAVPWLRLPRAQRAVPGVIAWRAQAVPIVDVSVFMPGLTPGEARARTLIVRVAESTIALPVDGVTEVVHVPAEALRIPHAVRSEIAAAEADVQGQLMALIDLDALVRRLSGEEGRVRSDDGSL
jgi:chemotaxis signal transduction protein